MHIKSLLDLCTTHGYWFIFVALLMDGLGAPPIAMPLLVIAGGLAAAGKMSIGHVILVASVAAALGDFLWYMLGRNRSSILSRIAARIFAKEKISLTRWLGWVRNYSLSFLFFSKFVPGIALLAAPAAGMANIPMAKFLLINGASRVLWAGSALWIGYSLQ